MRRNIFEEKISCWQNTMRTSANNMTLTIGEFLQMGASYLSRPDMPTDIQRLRQLYTTAMQTYATDPVRAASLFDDYKRLKKCMPLATMGGVFANGGTMADMLSASGVLCVDIDNTKPIDYRKYEGGHIPNSHVTDWERLKCQLSRLPFVSYAALSIGGYGVYLLIPIEDATLYTAYWHALEHLFLKNLRLTIDPQTKDITRPRFVSYDPSPHINTSAEVFRAVLPQPTTPMCSYSFSHTHTSHGSTEEAIRTCVEEIERRRVDITQNYGDWIDIASALYNELGEDGKQYFLRVSIFYPNANEKEIEYKWRANKSRSSIGIGTFFHICANYGIMYHQQECRNSPPPKPVEVPTTSLYSKIYDETEPPQLPDDFFTMRTGAPPF